MQVHVLVQPHPAAADQRTKSKPTTACHGKGSWVCAGTICTFRLLGRYAIVQSMPTWLANADSVRALLSILVVLLVGPAGWDFR